jgi:plasmid stability protein
MSSACDNVQRMGMIQIRNVPDDLHRRLKVRAAEQGLSLSDYLLRMAEREASYPTIEELTDRIRRLGPSRMKEPPSAEIRRMRDESG